MAMLGSTTGVGRAETRLDAAAPMRHSKDMGSVVPYEGSRIVKPTALTSLLVKQRGSARAELIDQSLRAAGARVTAVDNPYEAIAEAARAQTAFRYIVLGVDYFGRDEFRILPLLHREQPETTLVAYHSPGFRYKGELSELVGADLVLADSDDVSRFLESFSARPARPEAPPVATTAPEREAPVEPKACLANPMLTPDSADSQAEPKVQNITDEPTRIDGSGRQTLTEEELRVLLGEEGEE